MTILYISGNANYFSPRRFTYFKVDIFIRGSDKPNGTVTVYIRPEAMSY